MCIGSVSLYSFIGSISQYMYFLFIFWSLATKLAAVLTFNFSTLVVSYYYFVCITPHI